MLTEASTPGTDDWYLMELTTEMGANFPRLGKLRRYREGDAPVPDEASGAQRAAYKSFVNMSRLNMTELIVGAKANRQKPVGFRTAAPGDDMGDAAAWSTWKRSHMAVGSRGLFSDAGHYGDAFITVYGTEFPGADGKIEDPFMVPSDGWSTWTRQEVQRPWLAEAAVEVGFNPILGVDQIMLYRKPAFSLGGFATVRIAHRAVKRSTIPTDGSLWRPGNQWEWIGPPTPLNWTGDVPVVRHSTLTRKGFYENHLDTIDRINDTIKQRTTITAMQAFRQRAVKGDLPTEYPAGHEREGESIDYNEIFKAGPAALWLLPEGADIWESAVTDISPILNATKDDMKHLAAVTSTPLYVLSPDAASGSAEGASLARETLTFSVEELNDIASDSLATAHSLAFQAQRDSTRSDPAEIETIWASIDRASIIDRASAASQAKAGGMTQRHIDEKIFGLTPAEQRQAQQDREDAAFLSATSAIAAQQSGAPDDEDEDAEPADDEADAEATNPGLAKIAA
jgi:hypothetical protein